MKTVTSVYEHHYSKTRQTLAARQQAYRDIKLKLTEQSQAIHQIETKLAQIQNELITTGQLSQWQAYQYHSKSQRVLLGKLVSQQSKLEIQVAVAREGIDKTLSKLHKLKHKCKIISKLQKQILNRSDIRADELDDESSTQQWQLAQTFDWR